MFSFQCNLLIFIAICTSIVNVENAADLNKLNQPVLEKHELSNESSFAHATKVSLEHGINNSVIPERVDKIFLEGSELPIKLPNTNISTTTHLGSADSTHAQVHSPAVEKIGDPKYVSREKAASEKIAESKESKTDSKNTIPSSTLSSATVDNSGKVTKPQKSKPLSEEKSVSEINVESVDPKTVEGNTSSTKSIVINSPVVSTTNTSTPKTPEISKSNSTAEVNNTTTKKPIPKKPLITIGSEGLPGAGVPDAITPEEVLPSPSTTSDGVVPQFYQSTVNQPKGQPGYIIPIVITLFALPLLVLIGYQAVRRGKEAWRNRHYRRMDFLIDGMYND